MTEKDLHTINSLLERVDSLPDILHLRAAPIGYNLSDSDKELLLDTYQKLDDILKEVATYINVRFPGRKDYIEAWNDIDFDPKIGGFKVHTTDREHIKSEWRKGIFDLKSLIKTLKNEISLIITFKEEINGDPLFDEKEWNRFFDKRLENRADQADFFLDLLIHKGLLKLDKTTVRKHFKNWFKENHDFDLQIKNGDFAIEDGDILTLPEFKKENIPDFLKWFQNESNGFMLYLKQYGIDSMKDSMGGIVNNGSLIINTNLKIKHQKIIEEKDEKKSFWTKANVIIALIVGIVTIIGVLWGIFK